MSEIEKPYLIVVGVDYSPASDLALAQAFELAETRANAEVHVVNVVRLYGNQALMDAPTAQAGFSAVSLADANAQLAAYVERQTSAYGQAKIGSRLRRVVAHLRLEAPAEEIAQTAADLDADLIVVGTHGRRGVSRLLLGSVAEAVVRLAPCPVFVVRPKALPVETPKIEPPCPVCVETRVASGGKEFWCEQHRAHHGQRHTYHQADRVGAETEMPLVYHN
ncbi:MAG TPA: universal stress protein [Polyangiaceae bacterium]|jgi:nucleotide-binding universal stress UspA family protein|nr:universal stress protein [Polyangiaceae bacterium]